MVTASMLPVFLASAALVLLFMLQGRALSLHQFSTLWRLPKIVTRGDWLAVYGFLGVALESSNGPRETKPMRPWRLIGIGVLFLVSAFLLLVPLPLNLPLSFAQYDWNAFPVIQAVLAGAALAEGFVLGFLQRKWWLLSSNPSAEYPHLGWARLKQEKEGKK